MVIATEHALIMQDIAGVEPKLSHYDERGRI